MKQNPYLDRAAIRDIHRFYGRRREVMRIFSRLGAARPQSVSLVGERRIGKSSLLNYIAAPAIRERQLENREAYVFVKMDLQERKNLSLSEFFRELILLLMQAAEFSEALTPDFEGVRMAVAALQRKGRKIVILFDEFDVVTSNQHFGEEFFSFFRSLANNYDLAYITSSKRDLQELCHTSKVADSPFFNIFSTINLSVFNREEAAQLIGQPSADAGAPLEPYADRILGLSGYFPFYIQIACSAFFEHLTLGDGTVDPAQVLEMFLEEVVPHFNYTWEHFGLEEKNICRQVLRGEAVPPTFTYLFKKLEKSGYILPGASGGPPALFSTAFGEFIVRRDSEERNTLGDTMQVSIPKEETRQVVDALPTRVPVNLGPFHIEIEHPLGEGGMGCVYIAEDTQLKRKVAIKVISPQMSGNSDIRRRFLKEARSASVLNHPNICTIHQVGQEAGLDFIVMEYVEGLTIRDMLRDGPFEPTSICRIGIQVADALDLAHAQNMIHRDIKPANIMVNKSGRAKILDFGLVKWTGPNELQATAMTGLTEQGAIMGTVNYMSPEQLKGDAVDHRTDIFSLGLVLYEMATGQAPFSAENYIGVMHAILYQPVAAPAPPFPEALWAIIDRTLAKDPGHRYQTAGELRDALAGYLKRAE
jgi:serine/threonine-protein kinase